MLQTIPVEVSLICPQYLSLATVPQMAANCCIRCLLTLTLLTLMLLFLPCTATKHGQNPRSRQLKAAHIFSLLSQLRLQSCERKELLATQLGILACPIDLQVDLGAGLKWQKSYLETHGVSEITFMDYKRRVE